MKRDLPDDPIQFIKEKLTEWACYSIDRMQGWASSSSFVNERVQSSISVRNTYYENAPDDIQRLNDEIEKLPPQFKRIVALEYADKRPAKTKAAVLGIPRQVFYLRLSFIHEVLYHRTYLIVS